jgi:hypothetical protein
LACFSWILQGRLEACGPGFSEAVFHDVHRPDTSWADAVRGRLGILRPGLPEHHLLIAYRQLAGLPVEPDIWDPPAPAPGSVEAPAFEPVKRQWQQVLVAAVGNEAGRELDTDRMTATYQWFSNVGVHAIQVALETWQARCKSYGKTSPEVLGWLKAQDQVFRSSPKEPRIPDPVASPEWLRKDRDYQRAAALFYADRWDEARAAFLAISRDADSPWRAWGGFLIARCWMRQASLGSDEDARFRWGQARAQLECLLKHPVFSPVHAEARAYLEFVRYRLEPEVMRAEALEGLVAAHSGPSWLEQLKQADRRIREAGIAGPMPKLSAQAEDLQSWLAVMEAGRPSADTVQARWEASRSLPWLVAGLAVPPASLVARQELEAAAANVPRSSPAWRSIDWHRTRAGLEAASPQELPGRIQTALKGSWPAWSENLIRAQGRVRAQTLAQWATWAGSRVVTVADGYSSPGDQGDLPEASAKRYGKDPFLLDPEVTEVLNARFPLKALMALVESPGLSTPLRRDVAQVAWVRAVLLEDWEAERKLIVHLDPALRPAIPENLQALSPSRREFQLVRIFMSHPGLSPLLHEGLGRSNEGWVPVTEAVSFGTNWWCLPPPKAERAWPAPPPPFLTRGDLKTSDAEWGRLRMFSSARHWFGRTVTTYGEMHPSDPMVPEALHRFVRITRNAECSDQELSILGGKAFRMLHRRYPDSPWTKKTPVHY